MAPRSTSYKAALKTASSEDDAEVTIENKLSSLASLHEYIPGVITWLYNRWSSDASNMYRREFGIGITEWRVLAFLGVNKTGTSARISRIINLDKGATSRSANSLLSLGLITTFEMTGRNIGLSLTPKGRAMFQEMSKLAMRREKALLDGFSDAEKKQLNKFLHRMLSNLDKVSAVDL